MRYRGSYDITGKTVGTRPAYTYGIGNVTSEPDR